MDLIGLPWRITVGPRGLAAGRVELTSRRTGGSEEISPEAALARCREIFAPRSPAGRLAPQMAGVA
jgi:prolyl-tRNA synthetase